MAASGSFKRPATPAQHPPLRACPSRGARGGGLGRSGSSSRVGTGLRVVGGGPKAGADTRAPELHSSIAGDSSPGPVEGNGGEEGRRRRRREQHPERSCSSAAFCAAAAEPPR